MTFVIECGSKGLSQETHSWLLAYEAISHCVSYDNQGNALRNALPESIDHWTNVKTEKQHGFIKNVLL